MNKKDLSAVLLASVLGSAAFVVPVLADETTTDPQALFQMKRNKLLKMLSKKLMGIRIILTTMETRLQEFKVLMEKLTTLM